MLKKNEIIAHLLQIAYIAFLFLWIVKIYQYYFDMDAADWSGLILSTISGYLFAKFFIKKKHPLFTNVIGSLIPLFIFPTISWMMVYYYSTWIWLYIAIMLCTTAISTIHPPKYLAVPLMAIIISWIWPYQFLSGQYKYYERLIAEQETRKGVIHIVQWKNDYWLHYNDNLQFTTLDGHMYAEAYVHPIMSITKDESKVLLIGGDNGLVLSELSKYDAHISATHLDNEFAKYMQRQEWIALNSKDYIKLSDQPFEVLAASSNKFDLIIIDLPMANNVELNQYYSQEFYNLCYSALSTSGKLVTQTGNPILNQQEQYAIRRTLENSGFIVTPYQAQIPTIGQWSWALASKTQVKPDLAYLSIPTKWINEEAMKMMLSFGKKNFYTGIPDSINSINTIKNPILLKPRSPRL